MADLVWWYPADGTAPVDLTDRVVPRCVCVGELSCAVEVDGDRVVLRHHGCGKVAASA